MRTGPRPDESLGRIHLSCHDEVHVDGEDVCKGGAVYTESSMGQPMSYINFCPLFWQKPGFDLMKAAGVDVIRSWFRHSQYRGTDAKTVAHELTHLWWIADTNSGTNEVYGIANCAFLAWNCGPVPDYQEVVENADTYAVYAEYGYFAKRDPGLWDPAWQGEYPVQIPVQNW
ncbi:hypothetical protein N7512_009651 [Penicillium capsulatum]|nr:hypothetical protein N7512_009651 [Penicillium capsulatum]